MESLHKKRIATGAILTLLLASAIMVGGPLLVLGVILFSSLAQWEFYSLFWTGRENYRFRIGGLAAGAALIVAASTGSVSIFALALAVAFWVGNFRFLSHFSSGEEHPDFQKSQIFLSGILYVPLIMQFLLVFTPLETAMVILAAAASDTGAYYCGSTWGKHKIWPRVSPKKSWEGSLGGMAACTVVVTVYGLAFGQAPWFALVLLGLMLNVAAQFGDFFESALKRSLSVKDSGSLLPGHGGVLDRIDSLLLAIPAYALARELVAFFPHP